MTLKGTLQDPEKIMEYRRPVFMSGVFLSYVASSLRGEAWKSSIISFPYNQLISFYQQAGPSVKNLKLSFPNLTSLPSAPSLTEITNPGPVVEKLKEYKDPLISRAPEILEILKPKNRKAISRFLKKTAKKARWRWL